MSHIPGMDELLQCDLTEAIEEMMALADMIDSNYQDISNNNLIRYWQSKDVNLKSTLLMDLLDWLCCLAFSDGFIAPEEVQFINTYLKQSFSVEDIIDLCKFTDNRADEAAGAVADASAGAAGLSRSRIPHLFSRETADASPAPRRSRACQSDPRRPQK